VVDVPLFSSEYVQRYETCFLTITAGYNHTGAVNIGRGSIITSRDGHEQSAETPLGGAVCVRNWTS